MITIKHSGSFDNSLRFLKKMTRLDPVSILHKFGIMGIESLKSKTPIDTGDTASSWSYEIKKQGNVYSLSWSNSNNAGGVPVVILLQYGHATKSGTHISGIDFINPAIKPIFEGIREKIYEEVSKT